MVFANSRVSNPATNKIAKPQTWHRSLSNSGSLPPPPKQAVPGQNSYVHSGNSLVRQPAPATAIPSLSSTSRYYSMFGYVEKLAEEIKKESASAEGVEAKLWQVPETLNDDVLGK
ncbi:probable NAD(P)H dehydrogenase FQR1-like protein 1 [Tanacetum coccineum]